MTRSVISSDSDRNAAYNADAMAKERRVREALTDVKTHDAFAGLERCPTLDGFRGRAHFSIEPGDSQPQLCGVDPRTGAAPFEQTKWILPAFAQKLAERVFHRILESNSFPAINGFDLRIAHGREACHLSLTAQKVHAADHANLCETLLEEMPELIGVAVPSKGIQRGAESLTHRLNDRDIAQHYSAFFQTNLHLTPALAQAAQNALGSETITGLVDLYCGVGLHSVLAKDKARRISGADNHPAAIESARQNAQRVDMSAAAFHQRSADDFVRSSKPPPASAVILNPPRAGCSEQVIRAVADWNPARIVNVSCCLETHIENLRLWRTLGWLPASVRAFDMFPFSRFVETVTLLERES